MIIITHVIFLYKRIFYVCHYGMFVFLIFFQNPLDIHTGYDTIEY